MKILGAIADSTRTDFSHSFNEIEVGGMCLLSLHFLFLALFFNE